VQLKRPGQEAQEGYLDTWQAACAFKVLVALERMRIWSLWRGCGRDLILALLKSAKGV
jgi:hypothetical protein